MRYIIPAISLIENQPSKKMPKRLFYYLFVSYFGTCRMVAWYKEVIKFGNEKWSQGGAAGPFEVI
jgi:hypothetical protein